MSNVKIVIIIIKGKKENNIFRKQKEVIMLYKKLNKLYLKMNRTRNLAQLSDAVMTK